MATAQDRINHIADTDGWTQGLMWDEETVLYDRGTVQVGVKYSKRGTVVSGWWQGAAGSKLFKEFPRTGTADAVIAFMAKQSSW